MEVQELDFRQPRIKNRWTDDQRILLCCMFRFFERNPSNFTTIFNTIFDESLKECGFGQWGIPWRTLHTQWHGMRKDGNTIWFHVHAGTPFTRDGEWSAVIVQIEQTASALGINIQEKEWDDTDILTFQPRTPRRPLDDTQVQTTSTAASQSLMELNATHPDEPEIHRQGELICMKACFWCIKEGVSQEFPAHRPIEDTPVGDTSEIRRVLWQPDTPAKIPPLLYRFFNGDSQGVNNKRMFIAGMFADTRVKVPQPQEYSPDQFNNMFIEHASIASNPTPFISTFQSLLAPIHRAIRANEGAAVAILDSSRLDTEVFSAQALVTKINLQIENSDYNGQGEYLIWGAVPTPAIVCCFTIRELLTICDQHTDIKDIIQPDVIASHRRCRRGLKWRLSKGAGKLNRLGGISLGKFLRLIDVPVAHIQSVAIKIARNWKFAKAGSEDEFFQGVQNGYMLFSPTPKAPPGRAYTANRPALNFTGQLGNATETVDLQSNDVDMTDDDNDPINNSPCPSYRPGRRLEIFDPVTHTWDLEVAPNSSSLEDTDINERSGTSSTVHATGNSLDNPISLDQVDDDDMSVDLQSVLGADISQEDDNVSGQNVTRVPFEEARARIQHILETR